MDSIVKFHLGSGGEQVIDEYIEPDAFVSSLMAHDPESIYELAKYFRRLLYGETIHVGKFAYVLSTQPFEAFKF